jgi:hypothetical protein
MKIIFRYTLLTLLLIMLTSGTAFVDNMVFSCVLCTYVVINS